MLVIQPTVSRSTTANITLMPTAQGWNWDAAPDARCYPTFEYLLYIRHFSNVSIGCDIVFQWGKSISQGLPFCNFVRNRIYVISTNWFQVVLLAR
jgi:hypothetical protein